MILAKLNDFLSHNIIKLQSLQQQQKKPQPIFPTK
jgi:hypothetical protein